MKSYWSYSEKERSELTEEQVKSLLNVELMEKGVLRVEPPTLREIAPITIEKTVVFEIEDQRRTRIAFDTLEQAQAYLNLHPKKIDYEWRLSDKFHFPSEVAGAIRQVEVYAEASIRALEPQLRKNKEDEDANKLALDTYQKACKAISEVCDGVWEDWWRCRDLVQTHVRVQATFQEYVRLTNGDASLARTFLEKAFDLSAIRAAEDWIGELWGATTPTQEPSR